MSVLGRATCTLDDFLEILNEYDLDGSCVQARKAKTTINLNTTQDTNSKPWQKTQNSVNRVSMEDSPKPMNKNTKKPSQDEIDKMLKNLFSLDVKDSANTKGLHPNNGGQTPTNISA